MAILLSCIGLISFLFWIMAVPGALIRFYKKSDSIVLNLFFSFLFSSLLAVFLFAFFRSGAKTVMVFIPVLLIGYFFSDLVVFRKEEFKKWLLSVFTLYVLLLAVFYFCYLWIYQKSIENDVIYYSKIASYLQVAGKENYYHFYNILFKKSLGLSPYHYFEDWFTVICIKLGGVNSLIVLKYITYPFFVTVGLTGVLGLLQHLIGIQIKWYHSIIVLSLSFLLSIISAFLSWKAVGWEIVISFWDRPNFIFYSLCNIPLILSVLNRDGKLFVFSVCLYSVITVTALPGILFGASVFLFFLFILRLGDRKVIVFQVLSIFSFHIMFYLFYRFNDLQTGAIPTDSFGSILMYSFKIWKATLVISIDLIARSVIPVGLFYFLYRKKVFNRDIILFYLLSIISSTLLFQLLSRLNNSYQLPHVFYSLMSCLILLSFCLLLSQLTSKVFWLSCLIILPLSIFSIRKRMLTFNPLFNLQSAQVERRSLDHNLIKYLAGKVSHSYPTPAGYFLSDSSLAKIPVKARSELSIQPFFVLSYFTDYNHMVCLNQREQLLSYADSDGVERTKWWTDFFSDFSNNTNPLLMLDNNKISILVVESSFLKKESWNIDSVNYSVRNFPGNWTVIEKKIKR